MDDPRFLLVLTTAGSEAQGQEIARALVERELAACVTVLGAACSVYRWEGRVVQEEERPLLIKTTAERFEAVRTAIRELHTYEVPEVIALSVERGDAAYLEWIARSVGSGPSGRLP
jgi:periplasmic divalent cation tolerance protein